MYPKRILLVEDDPEDIELTLKSLEEYHLENQVFVVHDGSEALDYLYHRGKFSDQFNANPSVILLDLRMPKIDGVEVLKQIKADNHLRKTPVVILTSSLESWDIEKCYMLGANAYVVKPVTFEGFSQAIKATSLFWACINETSSSNW